MFLAVWLIYASDRLLDTSLQKPSAHHPESLHHFHHTHRAAFNITALAAAAAVALFLPSLPAALLGRYLILAMLLFFWLLLIHFTRLTLPIPKTCAPGIFFAAAVFIPVLHSQPLPLLLAPILTFAALCTLNCLLIQFWERHPRPAPSFPLHLFSYILLATPVLLPSPIAYAVALSSAALRILAARRMRLHPLTLRAAADLALLVPVLFLL